MRNNPTRDRESVRMPHNVPILIATVGNIFRSLKTKENYCNKERVLYFKSRPRLERATLKEIISQTD